MNVDVFLLNSFTANEQGGNPAGVVLNADELTDEDKLKIAKEVGYSETAFVCLSDEADFDVSFFTPTDEVDFCGHATLATFTMMYKLRLVPDGVYTQRTKAGLLEVAVGSTGHVNMELRQPQKLGVFRYEEVSELIGLDEQVLKSTELPVEAISTGLADVIIPVPFGSLDKLQPNDDLIVEFCEKHNLVGLHVFELGHKAEEITASCRNFAPLFGIPEESATGSSNGALACYLAEHVFSAENHKFLFEQGRAMDCISHISASVTCLAGKVTDIRVGGFAHELGRRTVTV